jgi:hypothetical protein
MAVFRALLKLSTQLLNERSLSLNDKLKLLMALLSLFDALFHPSNLLYFSSFRNTLTCYVTMSATSLGIKLGVHRSSKSPKGLSQ